MQVNEIIIVEGIHDITFLKSFLDATFIKTDGTSLPKETIELIYKYKEEGKQFIILTDPDYPGTLIRNKLLKIIPDAKIGFIDKKKAKTDKKVGIEHSTKEDILDCLNNLISYSNKKEIINYLELFELGLIGQDNSSIKRDKITSYLKLGKCNSKQFINRLNSLNMTKDELINKLKEILNDR